MKIKHLSALPIIAVLILSGFSLAHAQSDVFTQSLYYGLQNNPQVTQLQEFLTSQSLYSGPITGNYYFLTLGAVKAFQSQQGITPAAGYFGPLTMAAANKIADAAVGASNSEAITETGTSTPPVVSASSTAQLQLEALLKEVALLEQQLQAQQSSTQQQSQTLQQIAQNTTPPVVTVPAPVPTQPQSSTPAPTASITVNGSANSINIPYGTATTISWHSTNANSCNVSPVGWSGISSNQSTGNLTASQTYTLSCSGAGGSTSASITVNVAAAPTLKSIQLSGTNDGTNQLYTGVRDTNLSVLLFDQYGSLITTASATISTDDPLSSGVTWGYISAGVLETVESNNTPPGETTFTSPEACIYCGSPYKNSYIFAYSPQTDGQHTITVSALGSTQSIMVQSVTTSQTPIPGICTLTVTRNGGTATAQYNSTGGDRSAVWNTSELSINDVWISGVSEGLLYFEYASGSNDVWSPDAILQVGEDTSGTVPYLQDGNGMGLESTSTTGGLENSVNFKLSYPDGTACYAFSEPTPESTPAEQ